MVYLLMSILIAIFLTEYLVKASFFIGVPALLIIAFCLAVYHPLKDPNIEPTNIVQIIRYAPVNIENVKCHSKNLRNEFIGKERENCFVDSYKKSADELYNVWDF